MIVEITEEEREFLERICTRAEVFAMKNIGTRPADNDLSAIKSLKAKFRKVENDY